MMAVTKSLSPDVHQVRMGSETEKLQIGVPSKLAKLCPPSLSSINGRFHGNEEGEIEA